MVNTPLLQPPGVTLLCWDALTSDIFGVGVTPGSPGERSNFTLVRISGESGDSVASFELPEGSAAGWGSVSPAATVASTE